MAENLITLTDPADADYEDWFELWNPGEERVDLTGCTLTDDTTNPSQFKIPAGTTLEPHGFLLVWADGEPNQNSPESPDLHANFSLSKNGEMIALYGPDGKVLDAVLFGPQTRDVSQGRSPDGSSNLRFFTNATPRASNFSPTPNTVPRLPQYADRAIDEGTLLRLAFTATDADIPAQTLTYSLDAGSPEGASIDSTSGLFSWRPTVSDASTTYLLTVNVRDDGSPPLSASQTFRVRVLPLLRITDILQVEDRIEIRWAAVPGRHYRVEHKADLRDEAWIDLGVTLTASGDTASATVLIESVSQRVYRVVQVD